MEEQKTKIVEINGIKMEMDLRTAKVQAIDTFKVGDPVKLLYKNYSSYDVYFGTIVGFDDFNALPSITVAYVNSSSELNFTQINSESKHEILAVEEHDLSLEKKWILKRMDQRITDKERELQEAKAKKQMFLEKFGKYFERDESAEEAV